MPSPLNDLTAARTRIATAYDPSALEAAGKRLIETLADHFRRVESRDAKVLNWNEPVALIREARKWLDNRIPLPLREGQGEGSTQRDIASRLADMVGESLARGQNLHHPHYVGHQVPAPVPLAALVELAGTITNQAMAIFEMGPWATAVEHAVIAAVGETLGFPPGKFAGLVTSGGSLANLTGLLTARNVALRDAWHRGLASRRPAPVLVSHADAHYSVSRSAGILGIGTDQIVTAALDSRRRMDPNRLDETLAGLRSRGVPIIAVSSAACATPIGAFDPLDEIAAVCRRHSVWLHVDAAHGGALAFSQRHRHLLAGIDEADSVVCDAHKMMFMPALCAMLFYRNREHRLATFRQEAPYLFDPTAPYLAEYDSGIVNLECTKRPAAFGLWGIWSLFGPQLFADMVDVTIDLAQKFHAMLQAADDFEALHEPQCNIVAFRYTPRHLATAPAEQLDALQLRLRRAVIESGEFYLVQSRIDGRPALRTTFMNPLTTEDDLRELLDCIRRFGRG
ncbi:MAG TPA: pyridoxal-dependent decarboxylase [Lacipirellulaceae bacterium]|jgi:L-2,4-diaminobutyrate decarboxylase|nr:pyridoxal-dependent decarboxylase [Lacipirellulaceae bacterium]